MTHPSRLTLYQAITLAVMVVGYTGYYAGRSNFSVALPLLIDELVAQGWSATDARTRLGGIASLGVLAYAIGKFASGTLTEIAGGRRAFLAGMVLSALCTVAFALSGSVPLFTSAWVANRLVQSTGWVGMVKMTSRWFGHSTYARAMGIVSLSFLFGDALVRWAMGRVLATGAGWRTLFFLAASLLVILAVVSGRLLRESPRDRGLAEPEAHPENLFAAEGPAEKVAIGALWGRLASSPAFWSVCAVSLALTLLRETFNTWTPTFFVQSVGLSESSAASWSALFPLAGGVAVLGAGWLGDRTGRTGRAWVMIVGLLATAACLLALGGVGRSPVGAVSLVALIGFLMLAPYSYLAGAISLDFGGKHGSAAACGVIDGVGYLGGVLAGGGVARLAAAAGWGGAFATLSGIALAGALAAGVYLKLLRR